MDDKWRAAIVDLAALPATPRGVYRGPLTPSQCADGINAARANARRLCAAAHVVLSSGHAAAATQLCIVAVEEAGKEEWLRDLLIAQTNQDVRRAWSALRRHQMKNSRLFGPLVADAGGSVLDLIRVKADPQLAQFVEDLKQRVTYTDCVAGIAWTYPERAVSREATVRLLDAAERLINEGDVDVQELEIIRDFERRRNAASSDEERRTIYLEGQQELRRRGFNALLEEEVREILSDRRGGLRGVGCKRLQQPPGSKVHYS